MNGTRRVVLALGLVACLGWPRWGWSADLSGTWVLDPAASDPVDALLKAQGVGLVQRTLAARATVTQTIVQDKNTLTVTLSAAGNTKTSTLAADGVERVETTQQGRARVRSSWDGDTLVTVVLPDDQSGTLTVRRWVSPDGVSLTQQLVFVAKDGGRVQADRVFKKR